VILPNKHLTPRQSLLGIAAEILSYLDGPQTVNQLWERCRDDRTIGTFDRFVLALDLLFIVGAVDRSSGRIRTSE